MPKVACLPSKITGAAWLMALTLAPAAFAPAAFAQDRMKVVTTFTVLADMAANVAGDAADVVSITKPGAEIHGYEPTPRDIVKAQKADLVLWNGLNLERWFERFFGNLKDVPSAVLTEGIEPIGIGTGPYAGKPNPHAWMSPRNAVIYVENIRKALVRVDAENAAVYNANAKA
jgi:manganese/iron transport system substrate-binding protein